MTRTSAEQAKARRESETSEHRAWSNMKNRCSNPKYREWHLYGGRGIKVCRRWQASYAAFLSDMGRKPSRDHSLERRDVNGDYTPKNCRWATRREQARNKRNSKIIIYDGRSMTLADWADETGITQSTLSVRLRKGWTVERALTRPVHNAPLEHLGEMRRNFRIAAADVIKIRRSKKTCAEIAAELGVHKTTVASIRNGASRRDV